jgi:hypothetical protein
MESSKSRKILIIVEGEVAEVEVFKRIGELFLDKNTRLEFFSYKTNIYDLYNKISALNPLYVETISALKDMFPEDKEVSKWNQNSFSEIYLIFDYDLQDHRYKKEKLEEMLKLFSNETEKGKLYINYPMLESYRDHNNFNCNEFIERSFPIKDINSANYKKHILSCGYTKNLQHFTKRHFKQLCYLNICKGNYVLFVKKEFPEYRCYEKDFLQEKILNKIDNHAKEKKEIIVLNTSMTFIVDYFGIKLYQEIKNESKQKHWDS